MLLKAGRVVCLLAERGSFSSRATHRETISVCGVVAEFCRSQSLRERNTPSRPSRAPAHIQISKVLQLLDTNLVASRLGGSMKPAVTHRAAAELVCGNDGETHLGDLKGIYICSQITPKDFDRLVFGTFGLGWTPISVHTQHQPRRTPHANLETFPTLGRECRNFCTSAVPISQLFQSRHFHLDPSISELVKSFRISTVLARHLSVDWSLASGSSGVKWGIAHDKGKIVSDRNERNILYI